MAHARTDSLSSAQAFCRLLEAGNNCQIVGVDDRPVGARVSSAGTATLRTRFEEVAYVDAKNKRSLI